MSGIGPTQDGRMSAKEGFLSMSAAKAPSVMLATGSDSSRRLEYVPCPLCGGTDHGHWWSGHNGYGRPPGTVFQVVRCRHCGMVFMNPQDLERDSHIANLPPPPVEKLTPALSRSRQTWFAEWSLLVEPHAAGRSLLDFGCGTGWLCSLTLNNGWDAWGCDIYQASVELSTRLSQTDRLFVANSNDVRRERPGAFDVVNLSEVLEHLPNPLEVLRDLRHVLGAGGVLTADVPNIDHYVKVLGRRHVVDVPAHHNYWSCRTLACAAEQAGFEVRSVDSGAGGAELLSRFTEPGTAARIASRLRRFGRYGRGIWLTARAGS